MPSKISDASWHPAFMPNAQIDLIATKANEPFQSGTMPGAPPESIKPEDAPISQVEQSESLESVAENEVPSIEDNDDHLQLTNLRDALEASLASPGGVELDESPLHNGIEHSEELENDKADFPSEGPTNESKHLSTMSFARTVSEEVNWGEDDEVDPEWNLQRIDTDPFKLMAKSDRTNSFPQVPPAHSSAVLHPEPLAQTQAEDIMHEVEQEPRDLFGAEDDNFKDDFFSQQTAQKQEDFLRAEPQETSDHDSVNCGQVYGGDVRQEDDEELEARFEEGLPLVQQEGNELEGTNPNQTAFMDDHGDEEDFFARAANPEPTVTAKPPGLERKSTMQVMDSLNMPSHTQLHEDVIEEENVESSQGSLDRATGGGIAVSASTVLSQVFGDPNAAIHGQPENLANLAMDSGDGDLAAKWKAALAGDEFLDDEDDELLPDDDEIASEGNALDPAALFGSDDEGFLEDDDQNSSNLFSQQTSPPAPAPVKTSNGHTVGFDNLTGAVRPGSSGGSRYLPAGATTATASTNNNYAPSGPLLTDLSRTAATTPTAVPSPYMAQAVSGFPQQQRPELPKAQSFVDKAKGGYHSPYDLPMEIVKPRKRVSMQHMNRQPPPNIAPPRSSSMNAQTPPSRGSNSSLSPPISHSFPQAPAQPTPPTASQPPKTVRKSQSGFFEELPMTAKPRPAVRHHTSGLSSPALSPYAQQGTMPPPPGPARTPYSPPVQQHPVQPPMQQHPVQPPSSGLVAPERVSPYASLPTGNVPVPAVASRYSPAPPPQNIPPPVANSRYSPAPPNPRQHTPSYSSPVNPTPQSAPVLPHQPRTSSPLAHFERSQDGRSYGTHSESASFDRRSSSSGYESSLRQHHLPPTREVDENEPTSPSAVRNYGDLQSQQGPPPALQNSQYTRAVQTPPPPQGLSSRSVASPPKRVPSSYLPQQPSNGVPQAFLPPKRSQTQSPGSTFSGPRMEMSGSIPYPRPASVEVPTSPKISNSYATMSTTSSHGRPRGFSQGLNYIAPTDGRERDPLQRWRGAPVFAWGVGGTIMTSFPVDVPRYGMSQTAPMIVRSPGEVKIKNIKDIDPLPERLSGFPGPLKGKSKKKEVITWLTSGIEILEQNATYLRTSTNLSHEDKRVEERILLWKILRVFIDNDGVLEGNAAVDKAVRAVLSPGLDDEGTSGSSAPLYATGAELSGISHSATSTTRSDAVDPAAVDELRKHLLRGDREKAVWEAVDKRLWAHAMLISNTVSKELYKQVASEFVQKEVKNIGENTESLAALYEIFAGNFEESIDELVPPSARAGFQMVSTKNAAGPSKDALDGLDRWRETLGLVLSNRSMDDSQALNALGKLLSGYGRAEAAHICFLFARSLSIFGGIDDAQSSIVLVGSDHLRQPYDFDREMEPILLSEVFEYGMSLSNPTAIVLSNPHLAVYKLQHAKILAEYGFRDKALQYCEAIVNSITAQTKRSPYHHNLLVSELDDLGKRLKQSPKDGTSSWISKPSIDKAKGSVWATFNKFVAGEEAEAPTAGSSTTNTTEVGPFARIAGGTPTISRSPSNADIYGAYNGGLVINGATPVPITQTNSRYAPGSSYGGAAQDLQSSSYGSQPRASLEERSSNEYRRFEPQRQMSDYRPNSQPTNPASIYTPQTSSSFTPQSTYTPSGNNASPYESMDSFAVVRPGEAPSAPAYERTPPSSSYGQTFEAPSNGYEPPSGYGPPSSSGYEPAASNGYEPPSSGGYEPYQPSNDEPDSPIDTRPKKKSFMDDDEDDIPALKAAPSTQEKTKAEKDREADEAFRKAAEADAQKSKDAAPAKKGWGLGGWFGGSKKESTDMGANPNKPIRAKLGEASSFVYDPDLKRWVNKKAGAEQTEAKSATPPPPRAGPPRTASGPPTSAPRPSMGAPPMMAQRAVSESAPHTDGPSEPPLQPFSGLSAPAMARTASNGSIGPGGSGPPSAPPSRPSTSMSNASSIDDLLGPAVPRKGAAAKKAAKKKGRGYVDVMGDKGT